MALFSPARMGGQNVEYGYKGKESLMHLITYADGKPLYTTVTAANGNEKGADKWIVCMRWKVERSYRRIATLWGRLSSVYEAFVLLGIPLF